MVLGKGGADTMIRALEKMLTAAGGKIFTGAEVAEIATSGGKATGVRLASGETHTATKAVIAGVAPRALAGKLLPKGSGDAGLRHGDEEIPPCAGHHDDPSRPRRPAGLAAPAPSSGNSPMCIWRPRWTPWRGPISRRSPACFPAEPVLVVGQPTAIDPSRAPAGKHVLWVQVRMLPADDRRRCGGRDRAGPLGPGQGALRRPRHRHDRDLCARPQAEDPRPRGVLAGRSRARESRIWSAATRSAAAIICRRISCSARRAASRGGTRLSRSCISSAPRHGRAPGPARDRASCSPNSLAGGSRRHGYRTSRQGQGPAMPVRMRAVKQPTKRGN